MTAAVEIEGLVKDFRPGLGLRAKRVLHGVTFRVEAGQLFGFVGPNGAGKTTTLKVLMGLIRATEGNAKVLGCDVRESDYRQHVGFLPEAPYFYDYLSGPEFLRFYARVCGVEASEREARIASLLDLVGLGHAGDARLRTYSKGMLQRIGIAQALVHDPQVVFLDEPMSGIDPIGRKEIRDLILHLKGEGKTVFMNTHILSDVEMLCDRVAVIVKGRIRFEGCPHEFSAGGEPETDIVLAGVPPALVEVLEPLTNVGLSAVGGQGDRIEIRVPTKEVDALLHKALAEGARVISVAAHRNSLESIFLSAVEQEGV